MKNNVGNKKIKNATQINRYGKHFKSKLELYCYQKLKDANLNFQYEGQKFVLVEPFMFNNNSFEMRKTKDGKQFNKVTNKIRAMTYTPDFVGHYPNSKDKFAIETKGSKNDAFPLRWKMFKKYIADRDMKMDLYMPRNKHQIEETIERIKHYAG